MKYINTKTGAVLYSPFVISGDGWEAVAKEPRTSSNKPKEPTVEPTVEPTAKPEEVPSKPEAL